MAVILFAFRGPEVRCVDSKFTRRFQLLLCDSNCDSNSCGLPRTRTDFDLAYPRHLREIRTVADSNGSISANCKTSIRRFESARRLHIAIELKRLRMFPESFRVLQPHAVIRAETSPHLLARLFVKERLQLSKPTDIPSLRPFLSNQHIHSTVDSFVIESSIV